MRTATTAIQKTAPFGAVLFDFFDLSVKETIQKTLH